MSWPGLTVDRLSPEAPLFRISGARREIFYVPGSVAFDRRALEPEARRIEALWRESAGTAPEPECLTVNLGSRCNLRCTYCYSAGGRERDSVLDPGLVEEPARLVARHCAASNKPFHLVVHGGGEPTLHWDLLRNVVASTRCIAAACGTGWFGYIATNGQVGPEQATWLAREFDSIGLSCDGPPEFQDRQRPGPGGAPSSAMVARTAQAIRDAGGRFAVRATITPQSMTHQADIARWLCRHLGAEEIRFEPVYAPGARSHFRPEDALRYARSFLRAQQEASGLGARLTTSGVRLDELHGPHCNRARRVLHLMPDGDLAPCDWSCGAGTYANSVPEKCRACLNVYHCARECPERCDPEGEPGFRCLLHQLLGEAWIVEAAGLALPGAARAPYPLHARKLPVPVWRRGFAHSGREAWERIRGTPAGGGPLAVYVHVPFCDQRCPCCDCYSVPRRREDAFAEALLAELDSWSGLPWLKQRPVSTVHFGGGTPTCLRAEAFDRIVARISRVLGASTGTEWAVESTSSALLPERLRGLLRAGITRLHVGVQSLEPDARRFFGRREGAVSCLRRISQALDLGFTVSVDLIYGLPHQTLEGFVEGIGVLAEAGVHGFSLYQFQITSSNRRYVESRGFGKREVDGDWMLFRAAHDRLEELGYRKNHFAHFARSGDRNLYYTHAARAEDLLALGPSADGILGDYRYRHCEMPAYLTGAPPALEGGMLETVPERRVRLLAARLMAGYLDTGCCDLDLSALRARWTDSGLLNDRDELTAGGSWFIGAMLDELAGLEPAIVVD